MSGSRSREQRQWQTGPKLHVTPERQLAGATRFDAALALGLEHRQHVRVAATAYLITDPTVELHLDAENLTGPPGLGCYICEEPFSERLAERRCKGTP